MLKYEIIIHWSQADQAYIAEVPELSGCMAHGETSQESLKNVQVAMELWLEVAKAHGDSIPEPKGRRLMYA